MVFLERAATKRVKTEDKNDTTSASKPAPMAEGRTILPSPSPSPSTATEVTSEVPLHEGGLFCSELVAALYQRLGFLDAPFPKSHDYIPADFAQSLERPIADVGEVGTIIASSVRYFNIKNRSPQPSDLKRKNTRPAGPPIQTFNLRYKPRALSHVLLVLLLFFEAPVAPQRL